MRIIFENMHRNGFILKPVEVIFSTRKKWVAKHKNLVDYLSDHDQKIYVLIDKEGSFLINSRLFFLNNKFTRKLECWFVCVANGLKWKNIVILQPKDICKNDVLITYISSLPNSEKSKYAKIDCYKILDMNHFYARISEMQFLPLFNCLVSEADIFSVSKLLLSIKNYTEYKYDTCVKPYSFEKRFNKKISFSKRKNKAVATGSYEILKGIKYSYFQKVYETDCLHPMRREIYNHSNEWHKYIDSKITCFPNDDIRKIDYKKGKMSVWFQKVRNNYVWKHMAQPRYLSFDMVELYNSYKMAIVPEEITGVPAIGFVEAMACGCALLGIENGLYEKLGMKSGIHYIGYDGTSKNLLDKIAYYQKHNDELEEIANSGYQFALHNFDRNIVAKKFFRKIKALAKKNMEKNK